MGGAHTARRRRADRTDRFIIFHLGFAVLLLTLSTGCGGDAVRRAPVEPAERIPDSTADRSEETTPPAGAAPADPPAPSPDPPMTPGQSDPAGVYHRLEPGQTLYTLSRIYRVPLDHILAANRITDPTSIPAGEPILIPGATQLVPYPAPAGGRLAWPLRGQVTSRFGRPRGGRSQHAGLDIDGEDGDVIRAAAGGRVETAQRGSRYGRYLVIDHGGGLRTLYAHASRLLVKRGDRVEVGEPVALVGRSGNAHGSHLHFEVHRHGRAVDPMPLLRGDSARATAGH